MGEVYHATDTRLKGAVAIKVLPEVLASLNHPNIAHVYGVEEADGLKALAMELVEGPTLADRLAEGALSVDEALPIARQVLVPSHGYRYGACRPSGTPRTQNAARSRTKTRKHAPAMGRQSEMIVPMPTPRT
jgi:hypothetical protein